MNPHDLKASASLRTLLVGCLLCGASLALAQGWIVQTLPTRNLGHGQSASVAVARPQAATAPVSASTLPVRHVLVYPQPLGIPQLKVASGITNQALGSIWPRALPILLQQGVTLVYVDAPSDAERRNIATRSAREVRQDMVAVAQWVKQQFPEAQMHLSGFALVAPLLDIVDDLEGFSKIILTSSALANARSKNWSHLRQPVLLLQAPSAQCDSAPFLEVDALAQRSRFKLIKVGYERQESRANCGGTSQHALHGQEAIAAQTLVDWLDDKDIPTVIGHPNPQVAWREEIVTYQAPSTFGSNQLEATLLLPEVQRFGPGPYPVMVWNHGDVEFDHAWVRYKSRMRDMVVAREFLQLGVAVFSPSRRGVGMSEGSSQATFSASDGDATYKARMQAQDILPALAWLKSRPELDTGRVVMAGQSAGGYSTMYIASQTPTGLIGAIDFSGGRTDMTSTRPPSHLNRMMVSGFAEFGKTTRIPTLWVFAENDSRYTATTIRASHEAFQAAGGSASLLLYPPIDGDGHLIHHKPDIWRMALKTYLYEIGALTQVKKTSTVVTRFSN